MLEPRKLGEIDLSCFVIPEINYIEIDEQLHLTYLFNYSKQKSTGTPPFLLINYLVLRLKYREFFICFANENILKELQK